jgi:hypothetical protein
MAMSTSALKKIIQNGIRDLPEEGLKMVADFVLFIRVRLAHEKDLDEEKMMEFLSKELEQLSASETAHLEEEFENYEKDFPIEQIRK